MENHSWRLLGAIWYRDWIYSIRSGPIVFFITTPKGLLLCENGEIRDLDMSETRCGNEINKLWTSSLDIDN